MAKKLYFSKSLYAKTVLYVSYDFANNIEKVRFVEAFLRSKQLSRKV